MSFIVLAIALAPVSSGVQGAEESRRTPVVQAVEKVQRCVVSISSEKKAASHSRWPFSAEENQRPRVSGMGSGVLVDGRGYVLTNHHVVDKVQGIEVTLFDGTTYPARVLQYDAVMDLAVLKVDTDHALAAIKIGTSSDLMVGETVVTIGNAFGYENTVSVGIISALHRDVTLSDEQVYRNLIQTDACINPGNSGGPLINVDGELIGINVAVRAGAQGIGFALPIDEVKRVASEMLSTRRLASTWHGLVASEQRRGTGRHVMISEVQPGSPAEASGFKPGDELIRVGDVAVSCDLDLERGMLDVRPGHPAAVMIRRGNTDTVMHLDVKAVAATTDNPAPVNPDDVVWRLLGMRTLPVSTEYVASVSTKLRGGLYVQAVSPGSPAAQASIQKGDILVGMNVGTRHWETIRADNILYVLRQPETAQNQSALLYVVRRNGIQPRRMSLADLLTPSILSR
ncbi:MAG TPA: trypsin-like peptidase domain-containing protein [Isosphaeraceae bacterium]|nr:trypsin-like peptidase domain-containing protein [Isosphaeraceae bacterium]